ncbi:MAG: cupin domain-containing protein [Actinobacteria bacterium]|nr:cupin domain-containing protein [Actinomycetota bacterium]
MHEISGGRRVRDRARTSVLEEVSGLGGVGGQLAADGAGAEATDGHHHKEQEEAYVVISGSGRIRLDDEVVELKKFDVVRVAPHLVRGFEAGLEVTAVGGQEPKGGDGGAGRGRWA